MKRPPAWAYSAVQLALAGGEPPEIARSLNKPERSVKRLLNGEWARTQIEQWHAAVMAGTAKARIDPILQFQSHVSRAIDKLLQKLDCGDDKTEYLAACRILDSAGYKPAQRVEISEEQVLRELSPEELHYVATHGGQLPPRLATVTALARAVGTSVAVQDHEPDPTEP